ncbi:MAG: endonuclease/exonuclease/phosphatase family protein, partial [bacterium]
MTIVTWNVNSLRARMEHLIRWLAEHSPDVVCLQETKVPDELFPLQPLAE